MGSKNNTRAYQEKRSTTMAKPIAWSSSMALVLIAYPPPPGNLFAMGLLRVHMKELIQFCKSPKKIIYLVKATSYILFFYIIQNLSPSKRSKTAPSVLPTGCVSYPLPTPLGPCVLGWLLCFICCLVAA